MSMRPAAAAALSAMDTEDAGEAAVCGAAEALPAPAGSGAGALDGAASGGAAAAAFGLVAAEPGNRPEPRRGLFAGLPGALAVGVAAAIGGLAGLVVGELTGTLIAGTGFAAGNGADDFASPPPPAAT